MKKRHSFLICFLLAATALTPLATMGGNGLTTAYADSENEITVSSKSELEQIANNVNDGIENYAGKTITLTRDIDLGSWTPIGKDGAPFKGTFDGAGHTISNITITENFTYQGLFGYANSATIKNLCIKGFSSENLNNKNGVYVGSILGKGINGTLIQSCEIESFSQDNAHEIVCKTALGSAVGQLDGSTVEYVSSFMQVDATYNLLNEYTVKVGGFVGSAENTTFKKVSSFGGVNLVYSGEEAPTISSSFSVGGFAGELSGNSTKMFDCVIGGEINSQQVDPVEPATQQMSVGSIAGALVSAPISGQLASVAYTTSLAAFGKNDSGYEIKKDEYVMQVSDGAIKSQEFYASNTFLFEMNGQNQIFSWYPGTEAWDFDSKWVMAEDRLRLQLFQYFDVSLADFLDNDGLLEGRNTTPGASAEGRKPYTYNQVVSMEINFKNDENNKYYDISDILLNGQSLNLSEFVESEGEYGTIKTSKSGDVSFYKANGVYHLDVNANNATDGQYSFRLSSISYKVYIMSDENGAVRYSGASSLASILTREMSATSSIVSIEAVSNKKYKFNGWSIFYEVETAGDIEYDGKIWKSQAVAMPTTNPLPIKFSEGAYNQSFILMANFAYDPCTLSFVFDSTMITKIAVNTENIASSNEQVTLDKNETATIKVYVKRNIDFDSEAFEEAIKKSFTRDTLSLKTDKYKDEIDSSQTVYEFVFSTASLSYDASSTFNFTLLTEIVEEDDNSNLTLWIIIGSVGGGLLLIGGGLTIWLVRRKKAYSGAGKTKEEDYKNFYY